MKKYRANPRHPQEGIIAVEAERETACTIHVNGTRISKKTSYENYYDSFGDAKSALAEHAKNELANLEEETKKWKNRIERINDLKEVA